MLGAAAGLLLTFLVLLPETVGAQAHPFAIRAGDLSLLGPGAREGVPNPRPQKVRAPSSGLGAALRSLALPGWGQHELGQGRKWAYGAAELAALSYYLERRAGGVSLRQNYRDLAWDAARVHAGARQEGDFNYYERLTKWTRSGAYDADPRPGLQPETDPTSFNGSVWTLARSIFLASGTTGQEGDPGYDAALDYYRSRAYHAAFLWDWTGVLDRQGEYKHLIERSDAHFRTATTMLGVLALNHVLSGVDAFVSARLRSFSIETALVPGRGPGASSLTLLGRLTGLR